MSVGFWLHLLELSGERENFRRSGESHSAVAYALGSTCCETVANI